MKMLALLIAFLSVGSGVYSQCGKKTLLEASQTQYLDSRGVVQRTVDEKTVIEITDSEVRISPGDNPTMKGDIKSDTCNWKVPYKEGRSILKVVFAQDQNAMNATITVEGKDGKTTFLVEIDDQPDRKIRVVANRFQEKLQ